MIRGLYIAATGMQTQQKRMDVVTNNLANAGTAGYKQDSLITRSFREELVSRLEDPAVVVTSAEIGTLGLGIHIDEVHTSFLSGQIRETGLGTDLALAGDGFFAVQTPAGERYTRAGNFQITADGTLTTVEGYPVLGQNGPIRVSSADFSVNSAGLVTSSAGNDQLRLVSFADNQGLRKEGNNLYANFSTEFTGTSGTQVRQGCLESSNVELTTQMVDMISIQRNYEINSKIIKMMDERLGRAVNDIGRL